MKANAYIPKKSNETQTDLVDDKKEEEEEVKPNLPVLKYEVEDDNGTKLEPIGPVRIGRCPHWCATQFTYSASVPQDLNESILYFTQLVS